MPGHQPIPRPVDLTDLPPSMPAAPSMPGTPTARALTVVALYQVQRDRYEEAARVLAGLSRGQLGRVVECAAILGDLATTALLTTVPDTMPEPIPQADPDPEPELTAAVFNRINAGRASQSAPWVGRGAVRRILAVLRERPEPPNTDEGLAAVAMVAGFTGGPVARLMVREVMAALPDGKSPATPAEGVSDVR